MKTISICIDIGSDTAKVAYSYVDARGELHCGKLWHDSEDSCWQDWAYYDEGSKKWCFGDEANTERTNSFKTIVKVKSLLNLILNYGEENGNSRFYYRAGGNKLYPIFYFPKQENTDGLFQTLIDEDMCFEARQTPQEVCEQFFSALFKRHITPKLKDIPDYSVQDTIEYVSVYPVGANNEYISELERLIKNCIGEDKKVKSISATKAISLFAYKTGSLRSGDRAVIVNIGEALMSVAKVYVNEYRPDVVSISVDGADGHNPPMRIGGDDFDEAIRQMLDCKLTARAVLGYNGRNDRIDERGTHQQQFLLLSHIKSLKACLSTPDDIYDVAFRDGVHIVYERDVVVETAISREEFTHGIKIEIAPGEYVLAAGVLGKGSLGDKIAEYVLAELRRNRNKDVTKVIISGGCAETYGLKEYIESKADEELDIDVQFVEMRDVDIADNENDVFSASLGGAIYGTGAIELATIAAYFYGTVAVNSSGQKIFSKFRNIDKGTRINAGGLDGYGLYRFNGYEIEEDEMFSSDEDSAFEIGDIDSEQRAQAEKKYGLKTVSGGKKTKIIIIDKNGVQITRDCSRYNFFEGIVIDEDGKSTPYVRNDVEKNLALFEAGQKEMYSYRQMGMNATIEGHLQEWTRREIEESRVIFDGDMPSFVMGG